MKTLVKWAARLYPAAWRARYAVELEALLEDVGPGGRDLWDILRGALLMHMQMTGLSFWKILAGGALAGVLAAGIWSVKLPDRYVSTAVLRMSLAPSTVARRPSMGRNASSDGNAASRPQPDLVILYHPTTKPLPGRARSSFRMEDVILLMRNRDLRIQPTSAAGGSAFAVEFAYRNPAAAQATVSAVVGSLIERESPRQPSRRRQLHHHGARPCIAAVATNRSESPPNDRQRTWSRSIAGPGLRGDLVGRTQPEAPDLPAHRWLRARRYDARPASSHT